MPRDVTDADGTTWSCTPAYAGLATDGEPPAAARVDGGGDCYWLVCTPSGGAQSVRVPVAADWEEALADDALLARIRTAAA